MKCVIYSLMDEQQGRKRLAVLRDKFHQIQNNERLLVEIALSKSYSDCDCEVAQMHITDAEIQAMLT